jgi:hypothetical protein
MTIPQRFALLPKQCDCCGRTFIFEGYYKKYKYVFWTGLDYKVNICKKCIEKERKAE